MKHFVCSLRIIWSVKTRTESLCAELSFWIFLWVPENWRVLNSQFNRSNVLKIKIIDIRQSICILFRKKSCRLQSVHNLNSKSDEWWEIEEVKYTCWSCNIHIPATVRKIDQQIEVLLRISMNLTKHIFMWWICRVFFFEWRIGLYIIHIGFPIKLFLCSNEIALF